MQLHSAETSVILILSAALIMRVHVSSWIVSEGCGIIEFDDAYLLALYMLYTFKLQCLIKPKNNFIAYAFLSLKSYFYG